MVTDKQSILKARADVLAREPENQSDGMEQIEITEFMLSAERYGIETRYIREVHILRDLTPLPCTPPFVLGILNVRGKILSVIDIRWFFELPIRGFTEKSRFIVLHNDVMEFGILADSIIGVRMIQVCDIRAELPTLTGIRADYLRGITSDRLTVLDGRKLLEDKEIIVHEEV